MDFFTSLQAHRFVFLRARAPGGAAEDVHMAEREARREGQLSELASIDLPAEVRVLARQAIISERDSMHRLADRLLAGEIAPQNFSQEYEHLEQREESWKAISETQRSIRKKIRDVKERAESYLELLPRKRLLFSSYVEEISRLNHDDLELESGPQGLKAVLTPLTQPAEAPAGGAATPALLTNDQAKGIFELDTLSPDFEKQFKKLTQPLENAAGPRAAEAAMALSRLKQLKSREQSIEQRFFILFRQLNRILETSISRAEREAEKKRMLKNAERFIGIRLKPGTRIRFKDPGELMTLHKTTTETITKIEWQTVEIKDHHENVVGHALAPPIIHLSRTGWSFPVSRFRKWVDAVDAYEDISSMPDVLAHIGWKKLEVGTQLEYQRFGMSRDGKLIKNPRRIRVMDIRDNRIFFNEPVFYQSGPGIKGRSEEGEYRESLSLGEFVKWFLRQEVETAFSLSELRDNLRIFNESYNQEFNVNPVENPPISVFRDEKLYYPDDPLSPFEIKSVGDDRIELSNGESFTPAQFYLWVKENHVQKMPEKKETSEEIHKKEEFQKEIEEEENKQQSEQEKYEREKKEAKKKGMPGRPAGFFNFLRDAWFKTTFLSIQDIWGMVISIKEFVERKHKRQSQGRYAMVGKHLPGVLGTEFRRIAQHAEDEEVNLNKEAMHNWGIFEVLERLHTTSNKDVAKACIITLVDKGEMRWDDAKTWATINRLTARYTTRGAELYIPTDKHYLERLGKSGEDMIAPAMDALWGTGTQAEWFAKNVSTYNNQKNSFEYKGKQLEADPKGTGGIRGELYRLLKAWHDGEYVNPHEYEELIDFALKYGKASAEDKMFFLMMGIITKNPKTDETLLHLDRAGDLDGKYLNQFPLLDYFTNKGAKRPDGTTGPWREKDFHHLAEEWFHDDMKNLKPGMQFSRFMWHVMMFDDNFRTRMSKGLRSAEQMDHDDAHLFIPPASHTEIDMITGSPGGGEKKYFTPEGYANAYPGFSQHFIALAMSKELRKEPEKQAQSLKDALKSYVWYDGIIDSRFRKKAGAQKARLSEHHFNRHCVVDDTVKLSVHRDQLRNLIREIGHEYGIDFEYLFERTGSMHDPEQLRRQEIVEKNFEDRFIREIEELFRRDNGEGVIRAIRNAKERDPTSAQGLRGIRGWPLRDDAEVVKTKAGQLRAKEIGLL